MDSTSDYGLSDEKIVKRLMIETKRAAPRQLGGNTADLAARMYATDRDFWKGVVLARLARRVPICDVSEKVIVGTGGATEKNGNGPSLLPGSVHTVYRVWYMDGEWYLQLGGIQRPAAFVLLYSVKAFSKYKPAGSALRNPKSTFLKTREPSPLDAA